jgi:general secretion pathway protein E
LCTHCKKKVAREGSRDSDALWNELVSPWKASAPTTVYYPVGCLECRNTGFRGRAGIYEILSMSPAIRALVTRDADLAKIREQAYKEGMKSLRISGAMKINIGQTTLEEVLKVAPPVTGSV